MTKKKILVIDDHAQIRKLLFLMFKDDFDIIVAENGTEGLEAWRKHMPDIVILDVMLPDLSGYEVCTMAKADVALRDIPIIFLSAQCGVDNREKGYLLGAVNYVEKPFQKNELKAIIDSTLMMVGRNREKFSIIEVEDITINTSTFEAFIKGQQLALTPNEFKIIYCFLMKRNMLVTRDDLLVALGKDHSEVSDRTIDSHISHIRKKIKSSILSIRSVYGEGYKLTS